MKWLKIDVNEDAANKLHQVYLDLLSADNGISKGDVSVRLITAGMKQLDALPKFPMPHRLPSPGMKTIQIDKTKNASFITKIDRFTFEKNFLSRQFATRYCLYHQLGIQF